MSGIAADGSLECQPLTALSALRDCSGLDPRFDTTDMSSCVNPIMPGGANLSDIDYSGALFAFAFITNAQIVDGNLTRTIHISPQIVESDFSRADFSMAYVHLFRAEDTNLSGAVFDSVLGGHLTGLESTFDLASFDNASLDRLAFIDTSAIEASFVDATITQGNFENANLLNADFSGTTFETRGTWSNTICPDGSNSDDADGDDFTCLSNLQS